MSPFAAEADLCNSTSPTAYNVFSSYTLTSGYLSDNQCQTTTYVSSLDTPYSEILPSASGQVALDAAGQQDFINHIGFTTCSGGGERAQGSALVPVVNVTSSVTSTFSSVPLGNSISLAPVRFPLVFHSSTCCALPNPYMLSWQSTH